VSLDSLPLDAPLATGYAAAGPIFIAHPEVTCVGFFIGYFIGFFIGYFLGYLTLGRIFGTLGLFLRRLQSTGLLGFLL
jgi:hypothetical protein